jgi:hypothetical protein
MAIEVLVLFQKLYSASGYIDAFKGFTRNEMIGLLQEIGYIEYGAAIQSLKDSKISSNPDREISLAVGHLQSAYQMFYRTVSQGFFKSLLHDLGDVLTFRAEQRKFKGYKGACETAILIAVCYRDLNDKGLVQRYVGLAKECFEKYSEATINGKEYYTHNPTTGVSCYGALNDAKARLMNERDELLKVCTKLGEF